MNINLKPPLLDLIAVGILGVAGYCLYATGVQRGMGLAGTVAPIANGAASPTVVPAGVDPQPAGAGAVATQCPAPTGLLAGDIDPANGKKILYHHDAMVHAFRFDKPCKSPFMDMMLVPVYADGDSNPLPGCRQRALRRRPAR